MVDVKSKRCEAPGCGKHPSFGFPGGPVTSCAQHKGPWDVNLFSQKTHTIDDAAE